MDSMSSQAKASQRMYGARASKYEDSWHPDYSARFVRAVDPQPGQRILDLCCGTGLDLFLVAGILSEGGNEDDGGLVVGIDTTVEMLALAAKRQAGELGAGRRVRLLQYDVTRLDTLMLPYAASTIAETTAVIAKSVAEVARGEFDAILCSNAFVLFDDPDAVLAGWRPFLKSPPAAAARLIVDIPHPDNLRFGLAMERTARRLRLPWPSNRSWVRNVDSFRAMLNRNGFLVDSVTPIHSASGQGRVLYTMADVDRQYDALAKSEAFAVMEASAANDGTLSDLHARTRPIFREECARMADRDGRIVVEDTVFVYDAHRVE